MAYQPSVKDIRNCPRCGGRSYVVDSRPRRGRHQRRHKCEACGHAWNTMEIPMGGPISRWHDIMMVTAQERLIVESYRKALKG